MLDQLIFTKIYDYACPQTKANMIVCREFIRYARAYNYKYSDINEILILGNILMIKLIDWQIYTIGDINIAAAMIKNQRTLDYFIDKVDNTILCDIIYKIVASHYDRIPILAYSKLLPHIDDIIINNAIHIPYRSIIRMWDMGLIQLDERMSHIIITCFKCSLVQYFALRDETFIDHAFNLYKRNHHEHIYLLRLHVFLINKLFLARFIHLPDALIILARSRSPAVASIIRSSKLLSREQLKQIRKTSPHACWHRQQIKK